MKKTLFSLFALLSLFATPAFAQSTATPTTVLGWTQDAPDLATANTYIYRHYDDAGTTPVVLVNVSCIDQTPVKVGTYDCLAPFPAFAPAAHTLTLTSGSVAGESLPSTPLAFVFVVVPSAPRTLRILSGLGSGK